MVRKAVGAIVRWHGKYLLVHKVKAMEAGGQEIPSVWDFPKGGVKPEDPDLQSALLRELWEETGSSQYRILYKFDDKLIFAFPKDLGIPYTHQETSMFLVEYTGDGTDLSTQDEEVDAVEFFSTQEVIERLPFYESRNFFSYAMKHQLCRRS